ncbi:MAG TPA: metallophosphoesterase [Polyangiaceae bacterium]|nr:metallophosphoesterase [Polyangiaceae bacterium]
MNKKHRRGARAAALGAALALAAAGPACLDVAEGRAERDLTIGRAEAGGVRFEVEGGNAAVRLAGPGRLALWAGAPAFTVRASAGAGGALRLSVENALPDLALAARGERGGAIAVRREAPGLVPTERAWTLELPAGEAATLSLAPPDAADESPYRFAVFADVQERIDEVQDIYAKMNEDPSIRFALISGDLTDQGSRPELERFQREMKSLNFPCYSTLGNHELGTDDALYQEYFGRANHSFAFRGVRFTLLDSASATIAAPVYDWLGGWLAGGAGGAHVVAMHIPPLDPIGGRNGGFANRAEANKLLTRLADGGVDLTFYGHVHSYYAYSNAGIPAYVTGGGGAIPERLDGVGRHFLTVDIDPRAQRSQVALVRVD